MRTTFVLLIFFHSFLFSQTDSIQRKNWLKDKENAKVAFVEKLKEDAPVKLSPLLKNFDFKKVVNTNTGWYHHKTKKDTSEPWIETPVSANGTIYIKARYTGDVQYNINNITLIFGQGGEAYGPPLAKNSNYIFRKKRGNKFNEVLHLFSYQTIEKLELRTMYIIEIIARSEEGEKLKIKFMGEEENFTFTLTQENIKAIKESWELSQYLCYNTDSYTVQNSLTAHYNSTTSYRPIVMHTAFLFPKDALKKEDMKGIVPH